MNKSMLFKCILIVSAWETWAQNGLTAEFYQDFHKEFNNKTLKLVGNQAEQLIRAEPDGLRITIPAGQTDPHTIGFAPRFKVRGDFEITVTYEILKYEKPETGYGVGASLYIMMDLPTQEAASLERFRRVKEGDVYVATHATTTAKNKRRFDSRKFPTKAKSGKLRYTRNGPTLHYLVSEGNSGTFRELRQVEFGTADLILVRVAADTGQSEQAVDVRFQDLRIRAEDFPSQLATPRSLSSRWIWPVAGGALILFVLGGVWLWWKGQHPEPGDRRAFGL